MLDREKLLIAVVQNPALFDSKSSATTIAKRAIEIVNALIQEDMRRDTDPEFKSPVPATSSLESAKKSFRKASDQFTAISTGFYSVKPEDKKNV